MSVSIGKIHSFTCSHCSVLSQFNPHNGVYSQVEQKYYEMSQCQNQDCKKFMVFVYTVNGWGSNSITYNKIFHYPNTSINVHQSVPSEIQDSYIQGSLCLNVNSAIGAVTCFRRSLQQICKKQGATTKTLNDQIDEILPDYLRDQAHEIRSWGNLGAHPDDFIKDVKANDAQEIKDLLDGIFDAIYIGPYKVNERKQKRQPSPP